MLHLIQTWKNTAMVDPFLPAPWLRMVSMWPDNWYSVARPADITTRWRNWKPNNCKWENLRIARQKRITDRSPGVRGKVSFIIFEIKMIMLWKNYFKKEKRNSLYSTPKWKCRRAPWSAAHQSLSFELLSRQICKISNFMISKGSQTC